MKSYTLRPDTVTHTERQCYSFRYIGSEGTLGVIVGLTLKLRNIPKVRCGSIIGFDNIHDASIATIGLVGANLSTLCRCELLNGDGVRATNKKYKTLVIISLNNLLLLFNALNNITSKPLNLLK